MKGTVQQNIDKIRQLAKASARVHDVKDVEARPTNNNDSLLRSIRNKDEADAFMAELNATIQLSRNK